MSMLKNVKKRNRAFTLIELKTVSIIVGILMVVAGPLYSEDVMGVNASTKTGGWAASEDKVVLWASNPLEKIFRGTPPPKEADTNGVSLEALRNEYEPAQVCISSHDFKGPVRVKVNPLIHRSGKHRIESVNARFVGYVSTPRNVPGSERFSDCPDAYPDPLILDEEVVLGRQQTQPVWITVKIPKDALPGEYDGSIEVTTTAGHSSNRLPYGASGHRQLLARHLGRRYEACRGLRDSDARGMAERELHPGVLGVREERGH